MCYMYTLEYNSTIRKICINKSMSFAATGMKLNRLIRNKISQKEILDNNDFPLPSNLGELY